MGPRPGATPSNLNACPDLSTPAASPKWGTSPPGRPQRPPTHAGHADHPPRSEDGAPRPALTPRGRARAQDAEKEGAAADSVPDIAAAAPEAEAAPAPVVVEEEEALAPVMAKDEKAEVRDPRTPADFWDVLRPVIFDVLRPVIFATVIRWTP